MNQNSRSPRRAPILLVALLAMTAGVAWTAEQPARLYFSDAKISFIFPAHWDLQPQFPYGPLFAKSTQSGTPAVISCAISDVLQDNRLSSDLSQEMIKQLAQRSLSEHQPGFKTVSDRTRELAGHHAYEINWENQVQETPLQHQSVYFFIDNRIYAITLQAHPHSFRWLVPDFQAWLGSIRILSRKDSGALESPSHGGLWVHQTGGAKVSIPETWLIGVADDRILGATLAQSNVHGDFTAVVDATQRAGREFKRRDKKEIHKMLTKKGYRITMDTEMPFHGLPAYFLEYEGLHGERAIEGREVWALSPKGRWLFEMEADASFFRVLDGEYNSILSSVQFF